MPIAVLACCLSFLPAGFAQDVDVTGRHRDILAARFAGRGNGAPGSVRPPYAGCQCSRTRPSPRAIARGTASHARVALMRAAGLRICAAWSQAAGATVSRPADRSIVDLVLSERSESKGRAGAPTSSLRRRDKSPNAPLRTPSMAARACPSGMTSARRTPGAPSGARRP